MAFKENAFVIYIGIRIIRW